MKDGASHKAADCQSHDQYRQNPAHRLAPPLPHYTLTAGLAHDHFTTCEDEEMSHEWPTRGKKRLDRLGRLDDDVSVEEQALEFRQPILGLEHVHLHHDGLPSWLTNQITTWNRHLKTLPMWQLHPHSKTHIAIQITYYKSAH